MSISMTEKVAQAERNIRKALDDYSSVTHKQDVLEDVTDSFIETLAHDSTYAKQSLRELFRKSPVWDEELDAIVINGTRTHNPDPDRIYELGLKIFALGGFPLLGINETDWRLATALRLFYVKNMGTAEKEDVVENIEKIAPGAYAPGKKPSRIFKQICQAIGVADETAGSDFQRLYAQFADELSAKKLDFKLYVSINPAHFLTMSNPKGDNRGNTLTSCHSFNSTDYTYNCGCSGYARDNTSFIVFTVDDPHNPASFNNRKTTRQIFAYRPGSGLLLQSRMYNTSGGVYGAAEESTLYRDLIQREISTLEDAPNLWKTHSSYGDYSEYVKEGEGWGGYSDWIYDNFDGHISFRCDCDQDNVEPLVVGTYGLCVKCGYETSSGMYCDDCSHGDERCEDCGEWCDETFPVYDPRGYTRCVCQSCLDEYYHLCGRCGEYHHVDDCYYVEDDDEFYCSDCIDEVAVRCEECGEWHSRENVTMAYDRYGDEVWVCDDCLDQYIACDECGNLYHKSTMEAIFRNGEKVWVCDECAKKIEQGDEAV